MSYKENLRETKISRPLHVTDGWEVGDLTTSGMRELRPIPFYFTYYFLIFSLVQTFFFSGGGKRRRGRLQVWH